MFVGVEFVQWRFVVVVHCMAMRGVLSGENGKIMIIYFRKPPNGLSRSYHVHGKATSGMETIDALDTLFLLKFMVC